MRLLIRSRIMPAPHIVLKTGVPPSVATSGDCFVRFNRQIASAGADQSFDTVLKSADILPEPMTQPFSRHQDMRTHALGRPSLEDGAVNAALPVLGTFLCVIVGRER